MGPCDPMELSKAFRKNFLAVAQWQCNNSLRPE